MYINRNESGRYGTPVVESPISSLLSTMETVQQQMEQSESQQQDSIKSLNLQCDEEFDETLAERPGTSNNNNNHYHQQQQQQQQQYPQHSTDNHASVNNAQAINSSIATDSPRKL